MLVVMTGLPGTGKSTIAEAVAATIGAPVYSVDPLEAVLIRGGVDREHRSDYLAYDLAADLAESQLRHGRAAVVDAVNAWERLREWYLGLAGKWEAPAALVETICSDPALHRRRFEARSRDIPGFTYEPTWTEVEARADDYEPSELERLVLDACDPVDRNVDAAIRYVTERMDGTRSPT